MYREKDHAIVAMPSSDKRRGGASAGRGRGRGAKPKQLIWQHGDRVRVRAERIDPMRRRVEFALASEA
jgi:hypothetical protein